MTVRNLARAALAVAGVILAAPDAHAGSIIKPPPLTAPAGFPCSAFNVPGCVHPTVARPPAPLPPPSTFYPTPTIARPTPTARPTATTRPAPATTTAPEPGRMGRDRVSSAYSACWQRWNDYADAMPIDLAKFRRMVADMERSIGRRLTFNELVDMCLSWQAEAFETGKRPRPFDRTCKAGRCIE